MAPKDIFPKMDGSFATSQATQWAEKIRNQLTLVAPFDESQELPPNVSVDESIMEAPRRRAVDSEAAALASNIAHLLYPTPNESLSSVIQYEKDVVKLRKYVLQQRKRDIEVATQLNDSMNWAKRILEQGPWDPIASPWSLAGAPSLPMPVQIAEPELLEPFFRHLRLGGTNDMTSTSCATEDAIQAEEPYYATQTLEFEKGVVYSDRRMDLCKMVLGPKNISELMESLKSNEFITHFLLGNNIIGPHGAKCIADFLKEYPNRMDTWYLAGNCIDTSSFKLLVDEWIKSTSVTNIWLKRNPLGPSAADDVFRLITKTPNLRTLDLDQTELGDEGITAIFTRLAKYQQPVPLRHIYLNATGVGARAATSIGEYLASDHCALDSLYMTNNPIGSAGAKALAAGLSENKSLVRLTLASTGLNDEGVIVLCEALATHPTSATLDIGQSYATPDLGSKYNWITDASAAALSNLVSTSKTLAYLNLGQSAMSHAGLNTILEAIPSSTSLLFFAAKTIHPQSKTPAAIKAGQQHARLDNLAHARLVANVKKVYGDDMDYAKFYRDQKRWLVNDKTDVRKIDSVYRNRDAGLAHRGIKKLDKWWDENDNTLDAVMKGAVGPVCAKKPQPAQIVKAVGPACVLQEAITSP